MMSIRPLIAFVLLVGWLMACQASPVPAPSPTAVPTQLPAPTAEPTATLEPATAVPTVTLQPTGEPTPTAEPTPEIQAITLEQAKAAVITFFGEDNAEEGAQVAASIASIELVPPIEGSEPITGTQIFHGLTVTGTVAVTFTVSTTGEMQVTVASEEEAEELPVTEQIEKFFEDRCYTTEIFNDDEIGLSIELCTSVDKPITSTVSTLNREIITLAVQESLPQLGDEFLAFHLGLGKTVMISLNNPPNENEENQDEEGSSVLDFETIYLCWA